jgi:hypothetical protein
MLKIYESGKPRIRQAVDLDAVESEDHGMSLDLTDMPIEDGSAINDHAIFEPRELRLTVWASKAPGSPIPATPTRHLTAWRKFKALHEGLVFLDVITDVEPYKRILITSVSLPRDVGTTNASRFTVTF